MSVELAKENESMQCFALSLVRNGRENNECGREAFPQLKSEGNPKGKPLYLFLYINPTDSSAIFCLSQ